ncbi:hypothetical protein B5807_06916 [Epicoccum nigrum]|uniref:Uncharacterized protein n=1 Tax=Epicoccum nigrum TaxID=105696 RepID=A0A1Y2LYF5_EPING|nr:hypothetical protein B5807_06916 [Epicoccum nigrum]
MYKHFTETPPVQLSLSGRTSFYIPRDFLSHSRSLAPLLVHNTSTHPTIYIPDINPSYFQIYASFICSNTLQMPYYERCIANINNPQNCVENFWTH